MAHEGIHGALPTAWPIRNMGCAFIASSIPAVFNRYSISASGMGVTAAVVAASDPRVKAFRTKARIWAQEYGTVWCYEPGTGHQPTRR
ncbi:hypothetical protein VCV18_000293 [Metarhizium anisopliae]